MGFDNKSEGREDKSSESTDASGIAEYEPVKKQAKMDNDIIVLVKSPVQGEDTTINVWVQGDMCTLSFKDKEIISTGRHIQYAQQLVKIQFSIIGGLCSTLLQNKNHNYLPQNSVQVAFCNSKRQWIVISNMNCNKGVVNVYVVNVFKELDDETVDIINNCFGIESKKGRRLSTTW